MPKRITQGGQQRGPSGGEQRGENTDHKGFQNRTGHLLQVTRWWRRRRLQRVELLVQVFQGQGFQLRVLRGCWEFSDVSHGVFLSS